MKPAVLSDLAEWQSRAQRIHIIGGSGSGKSILADRLGTTLGLPVHHLDDVALDRDAGTLLPLDQRVSAADRIAAEPRWLSEGIYLGWTEALLGSADLVIWLDHVSSGEAGLRIVRRFLRSALASARAQRGWARFARLGDYGRQLKGLTGALLDTLQYHRPSRCSGTPQNETASREATAAALSPHGHKTVRVRTQDEFARLLDSIL